jgi:hypothetical protein
MFTSNEQRQLLYKGSKVARIADEAEILNDAVGAFRRATGIEAKIDPEWENFDNHRGDRKAPIDAAIRIRRGGKEWRFDVEVKPWLTATTAGLLAHKYPANKKWILVTRHAHPGMAEKMRELQIQYMDTDGNVYLDTKDLLVFVKGQKAAEPRTTTGLGRPFKPAGMQVIFALICNPGLEQKTYREIAYVTKTALGTINWTMQDLRQIGHLLEMGKAGRRIVKREALFDKWVAAYPQQLRPKQLIGRYAALDPYWWQTADLKDLDALWGGETAAAIETGYLEPEIAAVYIEEKLNELVLRFKLKRDPQGKVEIFRKFWKFRLEEQKGQTVPLPLIYADLLATGIDRNIETAKEMRDKKLGRYLR